MKRFKNRTVAICIASLISVLGAFGADNYVNTLMSIRINSGSNGVVSITAYTKKPFAGQVQTEVEGGGIYNIILPETSSSVTAVPNLTGYSNITSLKVLTIPYSNEMKGYTKIRIKTNGNPTLKTNTSLYVTDKQNSIGSTNAQQKTSSYWDKHEQSVQNSTAKPSAPTVSTPQKTTNKKPVSTTQNTSSNSQITKNKVATSPISSTSVQNINTKNNTSILDNTEYSVKEKIWIYILISLVSGLVIFLYFLGKDKMAVVVGEQNDFDLEDDKKTSIKKKIKQIDKKYSNKSAAKSYSNDNVVKTETTYQNDENPATEEIEEEEIIDLDSLFNQLSNKPDRENEENEDIDDLASFLDDFSDDEDDAETIESEALYDEEFFEDVLDNEKIKFTASDLRKLTELSQNEISEELLNNISEYVLPANKNEIIDKAKLIENILAEYAIKQNIMFTTTDVDTLRQLMSIELDPDFVTDLRTNYKKNQKKISNPIKKRKPTILKVHDLLPNLSEELKKLGNKPIESNAKPQVIYYMEGYDVEKLVVNNDLPDISKALKQKEAWEHKPSEVVPHAVDGYKTQTLAVADKLPDLADVKAHPEKYKEKTKPKVIPNEMILINSLKNVEFKPFYDSTAEESSEFVNESTITDCTKQIKENENEKNIPSTKTEESSASELLNTSDNSNLIKTELKQETLRKNNLKETKDELSSKKLKAENNIEKSKGISSNIDNKNVTTNSSEKLELKTTGNIEKSENSLSNKDKIHETVNASAKTELKTTGNIEKLEKISSTNVKTSHAEIHSKESEPKTLNDKKQNKISLSNITNKSNASKPVKESFIDENISIVKKNNKKSEESKNNEAKIKETKPLTYNEILNKNRNKKNVEPAYDKSIPVSDKSKVIEPKRLINNTNVQNNNINKNEAISQRTISKIDSQKTSENIAEKCKELTVQHSSNIIKSIECKGITCLLMKNDNGYNVIGKTQTGVKYLKHYNDLKTENLQARINEVKNDGTIQYLIRVSIHKFIIDVINGNMEFIMDLC